MPIAWDEAADESGFFTELFSMARRVFAGTACDLPGVTIPYDSFTTAMWAAVRSGHVAPHSAEFVQRGLKGGFMAGIQMASLKGQRCFQNYPSATGEFRVRVARAIAKRVADKRTLDLGVWTHAMWLQMQAVFGDCFIFPMGATGKPLEPNSARPTSDHTRTGLNAATDMSLLSHSLSAVADIAAALHYGYAMHVSDVDSAFPMLPWAPCLWPYFFHRFYPLLPDGSLGARMHLYVNINGDFGTRGLPGAFKIFLVDVAVNMARAVGALTLPMPVYVDDLTAISSGLAAAREMGSFQEWASKVCGIMFKRIKDKPAAFVQLALGFWWDSFEGTRTLEEKKLLQYVDMLDEFSARSSLSLLERQQAAGRMQRAIMTMPPGAACLLSSLFALMAGLSLAWHKRRTTKSERDNYRFFANILRLNLGRGYYTHSSFAKGETVKSDASKKSSCTGGGWFTSTGRYDWWLYGKAAARKPIDFLEGDTVVSAVESRGHAWFKQWIPFGIDNQAFQKSAIKGWSRAERLTLLLKRLFVLQVRFSCVLKFYWLDTVANYLADHLSRDRADDFLAQVGTSGEIDEGVELVAEPNAGRTRTLDMSAPFSDADMAAIAAASQGYVDMVQHSRRVSAVVRLQALARGFLSRLYARECELDLESILNVSHHGQTHPEFDEDSVMSVTENAPAYFAAQQRHASARPAGGVARLVFLSMMVMGGGASPHDSYSAQSASVQFPRASLFTGVPEMWVSRLDALLDNRLRPSSMRTVTAALAHWSRVHPQYDWPVIIATDDPERGGKLVTFVLHLLDDTDIVADSITGYVWGLRTWMKLQRQADPVFGVLDWRDFMTSVRVLAHVPHEPRRLIPLELIEQMAEVVVREHADEFQWVQFMFFAVVLLLTFSRSECPCPKHFTGPESWDDNKHWCVRDIKICLVAGVWVLAVRFKAIKQDPRIERPAARGDGSNPGASKEGGSDWSYIVDAPDSIRSPFAWYRRLMQFHDGVRSATAPFFVALDRVRPYTYTAAMSDLKTALAWVSEDVDFGLHGFRVTGYNESKDANGEELTVAHGGWRQGSNTRYERFALRKVFDIARKMLAAKRRAVDGDASGDSESDDGDAVELIQPQVRPLSRSAVVRHSGTSATAVPPAVVVQPAEDAAAAGASGPIGPLPHVTLAARISAHVGRAMFSPPNLRSSSTGE